MSVAIDSTIWRVVAGVGASPVLEVWIGGNTELDSSTCDELGRFLLQDLRQCAVSLPLRMYTRECRVQVFPSPIDSARLTELYRKAVHDVIDASHGIDILQMNAIFHMLNKISNRSTYSGGLWPVLSDHINDRHDFTRNPELFLRIFLTSCDYPEFNVTVPSVLREMIVDPDTSSHTSPSNMDQTFLRSHSGPAALAPVSDQ